MADWGEFFSRIGQGLNQYGSYRYDMLEREKERELEEKRRAEDRAFQEKQFAAQQEQFRLEGIRADRELLMKPVLQRQSDLAKRGIDTPPEFTQWGMNAQARPESDPRFDLAGGVMQGIRSYGQGKLDEFSPRASEALNRAYQGKGLSEPIVGGGMATIDPSVRATLTRVESDAREGAADRATDIKVAEIGANARRDIAKNRPLPGEPARRARLLKRAIELQQPKTRRVGSTDLPTGEPGMSEEAAFARAFKEDAIAHGEYQLPAKPTVDIDNAGWGAPQLAVPGLGSFGRGEMPPTSVAESAGVEGEAVAEELPPLTEEDIQMAQDDPLYRQWLEDQGYELPE